MFDFKVVCCRFVVCVKGLNCHYTWYSQWHTAIKPSPKCSMNFPDITMLSLDKIYRWWLKIMWLGKPFPNCRRFLTHLQQTTFETIANDEQFLHLPQFFQWKKLQYHTVLNYSILMMHKTLRFHTPNKCGPRRNTQNKQFLLFSHCFQLKNIKVTIPDILKLHVCFF